MKKFLFPIFLLFALYTSAQSKVGGIVLDESNNPVAFANVIFKNSTEGTITNDNGRFYMESDKTYTTLVVSFIGYEDQEIPLTNKVTYNLEIKLVESAEQLQEVIVFSGKQSKKNNPAVEILKKIWAKKRENGVRKFKQYAYDKYEKIEFDLNTIDSALMKSKIFKGLEFMFQDLDTSRITGKTYLPIFLNETFSKVNGDNLLNEEKEEVDGDRKLPIVIGAFEAQSIAIALEKEIKPPRPLTHDLFKNFADRFDIVIKQVIIHKLVDGVFYSSIICERDKIEEIIDARTSDAIALALRFNAPIFTYKTILDKAGIFLKFSSKEKDKDENSDESIMVDEILQEGETVEIDSGTNEGYSELTIDELNKELDKAVANEDYEKAAKLRDEISKRN